MGPGQISIFEPFGLERMHASVMANSSSAERWNDVSGSFCCWETAVRVPVIPRAIRPLRPTSSRIPATITVVS